MSASYSAALLSRLMAEEKIEVIEGNFSTASFDVRNRVLRLPVFKTGLSEKIGILFITHEIGHALYTPEDGWHDSAKQFPGMSRSLINIVEDVRIERLIKEKYPGSLYYFYGGYKELMEQDFFGVKDLEDLNTLGFLNRLNLKAKGGDQVEIDFDDEEQVLFDECYLTETFDDVLLLCAKIAEFLKERKQPEPPEPEKDEDDDEEEPEPEDSDNDDPSGGGDDSEESDEGDSGDSGEGADEGDQDSGDEEGQGGGASASEDEDGDESSGQGGGQESEDGEETNDETGSGSGGGSDEDGEEESKGKEDGDECSQPEVELDWDSTDPTDDENISTDLHADKRTKDIYENNDLDLIKFPVWQKLTKSKGTLETTKLRDHYSEFLLANKPSIDFLTSQFKQRKAAYNKAMSRKKTSGDLDGKRLYDYKTSQNLFKKRTIRPKQKNHGVMMLLDNSGSMHGQRVKAAVKQITIMVEFCMRNSIPFEISKFSHGGGYSTGPDGSLTQLPNLSVIVSSEWSKAKVRERLGKLHDFVTRDDPPGLVYGSTPLEAHVLSQATRCMQFKKTHSIEKLHFMCLTDGAGDRSSIVKRKIIMKSDWTRPVAFNTNESRFAGVKHTYTYYVYQFLRETVADTVTLFSMANTPETVAFGSSAASRLRTSSKDVTIFKNEYNIDTIIHIPSQMLEPMIEGTSIQDRKAQKLICQALINNIV